ncbi:unnamed protein product [Ambrosiozyma monospora]|uniref:Unnamed protein product n=1 Tax=Ambrosiozyma monospora TaxID=43982 RepID=A0ACB5TDW7_AMBMO|nr:unnamed protein product [Ambrosiozyma monospora]
MVIWSSRMIGTEAQLNETGVTGSSSADLVEMYDEGVLNKSKKATVIKPRFLKVNYTNKGSVPSNLKVKTLKVLSGLKANVKPFKGVKYITKTGDFTIQEDSKVEPIQGVICHKKQGCKITSGAQSDVTPTMDLFFISAPMIVEEANINTTLDPNSIDALSMNVVQFSAGFSPDEIYYIPRDIEAPDSLKEQIFSWIDKYRELFIDPVDDERKQIRTDGFYGLASQLLNTLEFFRRTCLQGVAVLLSEYPTHLISTIKPFNTEAFKQYAKKVVEAHSHELSPEELVNLAKSANTIDAEPENEEDRS